MDLDALIREYGYLAILIGTFLEGETILVLGGLAANLGYLEIQWVLVSAFLGSFSGDQLYFHIGRHYGPRIIARRLSWQESAEKVYHILRRHQNFLILTFRFYYGLRNVTPFAIGAAGVDWRRFLLLNTLGAVVWTIVLAYLGYFFGAALEHYLPDFRKYQVYLLVGLLMIGITVWAFVLEWHRIRSRAWRRDHPDIPKPEDARAE
jgi:membrane protein DedA with SNARE-associated domain